MKKMLFSATALAFAGALAFSSCKKDDKKTTPVTPTKSRKDMLVGTWTSSFEATDSNSNKTLDESEKSYLTGTDLYTYLFNADGTGKATGTGISFSFNWYLQNSDQQIGLVAFGDTTLEYFHTITDNQLILEDRSSSMYSWQGLKK